LNADDRAFNCKTRVKNNPAPTAVQPQVRGTARARKRPRGGSQTETNLLGTKKATPPVQGRAVEIKEKNDGAPRPYRDLRMGGKGGKMGAYPKDLTRKKLWRKKSCEKKGSKGLHFWGGKALNMKMCKQTRGGEKQRTCDNIGVNSAGGVH